MQHRPLGRSGLSIAPVVFGGNVFGWTADETTSFRLLDRFRDAGFNAIDTADVYSRWVDGHVGGESETIIGAWLKSRKVPRDEVVIITKVGMDMGQNQGERQGKPDLSARWIEQSVETSLKRLQTDHIDVYLSHTFAEDCPQEETLAAYARLQQQGKIRAHGCSNFSADQLQASLAIARRDGLPRYEVIQPEYNLYTRDRFDGALADLCQAEEIGVISYYALAAGFLTGKYRKAQDADGKARSYRVTTYLNDRGHRILEALDAVAADTGSTPASVAIAWVAARPGITAPIASATSLGQLDSLIAAGTLRLTPTQMQALTEAGA